MGVPAFVIARMVVNMVIEGVIGVIPIIGDIFDFIFKSNRRNVNLMKTYLENPEGTTSRSPSSVLVFLGILFIVLIITIWLILKVSGWALGLLF